MNKNFNHKQLIDCFNNVNIEKDREENVIEFLETLEDDDDVQNVYSNINFGNS